MEQMPEYKEGFVTLWRNGSWIQIPMTDMPKIIEEDSNGTQESPELPSGE